MRWLACVADTLHYHHDKHHKAYVQVNELIAS
jgi:superoxide dismutase